MRKTKTEIIRRSSHNVSRQLISPNALKTLYRLRDNGFSACLVGGCVRDLLLERKPKDFDIATDATPSQIKRIFRNCRLVGRRFRLAHLHFKDEILEVATYRANFVEPEPAENDDSNEAVDSQEPIEESPRPDHQVSEHGVILRDNLFGTAEEDSWRRDFTINALSYNITDFSIIDYVGGMEDLGLGIIRTIGDPAERFTEDPVRMLRAVRFAGLLGFTIEKHTWQALVELAHTIGRASPARLFDELLKLFLCSEGEKCSYLLLQSGLFEAIFPNVHEWLAARPACELEGPLHRALAFVDDRVKSSRNVSPALLLALLFGEYLAEKEAPLLAKGMRPQERIDRVVAEFMGEISAQVTVPQKSVIRLREILLLQQRFTRMPGRRPEAVIARPGFSDALEYLRFCALADNSLEKICGWWGRLAEKSLPAGAGEDAAAEAAPETGSGNKRRRRRRKRR
jgi:poly(A) polymerase